MCIMLNLTGTNELIELNCRTWWSDKKYAQPTKKTVIEEESLPFQQDKPGQKSTVPPESVYFAIGLA